MNRIEGITKVQKVLAYSNKEKLYIMADLAYRYTNDVYGMKIEDLWRRLRSGYHLEEGEIFQRPRITIQNGGDCDDQAIAVVEWAKGNGVPWMLATAGVKTAEHVTTYLRAHGQWKNVDGLPYAWPRNMRHFQTLTSSEFEESRKE